MNGQRAIGTTAAPAHLGGTPSAARTIPGTSGGTITGTDSRALTGTGAGAITRAATGAIPGTGSGKPATRSVTR
ncbi:hypothetical protein [Streptomyces sasae]|uniref:hypothetical protein n=1 Tax=Streptomyces sasae TaxID=1266772 RepID=UPI00292F020E|nr:hypothetical protein [Streptomyces sasae]